jgi:hypothetical protein
VEGGLSFDPRYLPRVGQAYQIPVSLEDGWHHMLILQDLPSGDFRCLDLVTGEQHTVADHFFHPDRLAGER